MFSGVLSCSDTKMRSLTAANNLEMAVCLFSKAAETAVFQFKAVVHHVLVSVHERAPLSIQRVSRLKMTFELLKHSLCPFASVVLSRFQPAVMSARSSSSRAPFTIITL